MRRIQFFYTNIDSVIAFLGFSIFASFFIFLSLYNKQIESTLTARNSPIILYFVCILVCVICLFWLLIRNKIFTIVNPIQAFNIGEFYSKIFSTWFFILYILSIFLVYFRPEQYERPFFYFLLLVFMAGLITLEIFAYHKFSFFILIQIILLGFSISWTQQWIFPYIVGVDPWYHFFFTSQILKSGVIPEGVQYTYIPIFHILIAITSEFSGLDYKLSALFSVSLLQIICNVFFIYLIGKKLIKNNYIALLSGLIVILSNYHLFMSYTSIPNGFGGVWIPILLFILLTIFFKTPKKAFILSFLVILASLFTHDLIAITISFFLFIIWIILKLQLILPNVKNHHLTINSFFLTSFVILFAYWTFYSGRTTILSHFLKHGLNKFSFSSTPSYYSHQFFISIYEQLFNYSSLFIFFAFSSIGALYLLSKKGDDLSKIYIMLCTCPVVISFISIIVGFSVIEYRWLYIAQILMSVLCAYGLFIFAIIFKNKIKFHILLLTISIAALAFFAIMGSGANVDNNYFTPYSKFRASPIASELAISHFLNYSTEKCLTDTYFGPRLKEFCKKNEIGDFTREILNKDMITLNTHLIIVRKIIISDSFLLFSDIYRLNYNLKGLIESSGFSKIFDSGSTYGYL